MKANEFMKKLEQNPEYQKLQEKKHQEKQTKISEINEIEHPFIEILHANGFNEIKDTSDLLRLKKVDNKLREILLQWIPKMSNKYNSQENLVRALAVANNPFDGAVLISLFDAQESTENLRWAIGNTIASTAVENISDWLENKLTDAKQPKENQMLVYAVIKYFDREKAKKILSTLFEKHPLQVADAFTYIGNHYDAGFLKEKSRKFKGEALDEINKAIKKLTQKK